MKKIKILTRKERLQVKAKKLILCSAIKKSSHCLEFCFHGEPHHKETERDAFCHTKKEVCSLSKSGNIYIVCKKLTKKAQKEWVEKELNGQDNNRKK